jgi:transposase-like protein
VSGQEGWVVDVEQWAEIRRMHFVSGVSIKEVARRTGRDRNTVRRALRAEGPPGYRRASAESKLEPFREEIHRLLREDPTLPGVSGSGAAGAVGLCGFEDDHG